MKTKKILFWLVILLIVFGVSACTRSLASSSKSGGSAATATVESVQNPVGTASDVMEQIYMFATQTAQVLQGGDGEVPPTVMPTKGEGEVPGETPVPPEGTPNAPAPTGAPANPEPTSPPKPTKVQVPTATPGRPETYTLKSGEFPYCIARRFNVDPGELLRLNGLGTNPLYHAGMTLKIPQSGKPFPGKRSLRSHPTTYTVKSGDTIYSIACLFGDVSPEAIAYANNMEKPYKVKPGQTLQIP